MNNNLTMLIHVYMQDKFIDMYMVLGMWSSYTKKTFNLNYLQLQQSNKEQLLLQPRGKLKQI